MKSKTHNKPRKNITELHNFKSPVFIDFPSTNPNLPKTTKYITAVPKNQYPITNRVYYRVRKVRNNIKPDRLAQMEAQGSEAVAKQQKQSYHYQPHLPYIQENTQSQFAFYKILLNPQIIVQSLKADLSKGPYKMKEIFRFFNFCCSDSTKSETDNNIAMEIKAEPIQISLLPSEIETTPVGDQTEDEKNENLNEQVEESASNNSDEQIKKRPKKKKQKKSSRRRQKKKDNDEEVKQQESPPTESPVIPPNVYPHRYKQPLKGILKKPKN